METKTRTETKIDTRNNNEELARVESTEWDAANKCKELLESDDDAWASLAEIVRYTRDCETKGMFSFGTFVGEDGSSFSILNRYDKREEPAGWTVISTQKDENGELKAVENKIIDMSEYNENSPFKPYNKPFEALITLHLEDGQSYNMLVRHDDEGLIRPIISDVKGDVCVDLKAVLEAAVKDTIKGEDTEASGKDLHDWKKIAVVASEA